MTLEVNLPACSPQPLMLNIKYWSCEY